MHCYMRGCDVQCAEGTYSDTVCSATPGIQWYCGIQGLDTAVQYLGYRENIQYIVGQYTVV